LRRASPRVFLKDYSNIKRGTSGVYLIFTWHIPDFNAQSIFDMNITGKGKTGFPGESKPHHYTRTRELKQCDSGTCPHRYYSLQYEAEE